MGSSPLARGLQLADLGLGGRKRIIPARAGFTNVAGKNVDNVEGSSPLARGLLVTLSANDVISGIIPARAGFTRCDCVVGPEL